MHPKGQIDAVFLSYIPAIIPAIPAFRAVKDKLYTIPFIAANTSLSNVSVSANTNYFDMLEVNKISQNSGEVNLRTTLSSKGEISSIIRLEDEISGLNGSILVTHSRLIGGITNKSIIATKNIIKATWQIEISSSSEYSYSAIEPQFTLSEAINFKAYYSKDGFNQSYLFKEYKYFNDFEVIIILEQPYTGELIVNFTDLLQGIAGTASVYVDYQG